MYNALWNSLIYLLEKHMSEACKISLYRERLNNRLVSAEIPDEMFSTDNMRQAVLNKALACDMNNTIKALQIMDKYHTGEYRKGDRKVPYIVHPLIMANHAISLGIADDVLLPVCLLHDVIEDTPATLIDLDMPDEITKAVELLTFEIKNSEDRAGAKKRYYENIAGNKTASVVKVLDRCNNISDMAIVFSKNRMIEYIAETENYILPLLEIIKDEYEDMHGFVFILKYQIISLLESLKKLI